MATGSTEFRLPTLMHHPAFRLDIACQNVAHYQPPQVSRHHRDEAAHGRPGEEIRAFRVTGVLT